MLRLLAIVALVLCSAPAYSADGPDLNDKSAYGLIPPGFYVFCKNHPAECEPVEQDVVASDWVPVLDRVNKSVNASITYKKEGKWDQDIWTVSPKEGDCDDYTVTKRQQLIEAGVPRGAMRAAYAFTARGIEHVFLIVSTTMGDFVLDNESNNIYDLERAKVIRLSVQDASRPQIWWQVY